MGRLTERKIEYLISQTNDVFESYGSVNTDFADFATMALAEFKELLGMPDLTDRELKQLIRRAAKRHRAESSDDCWKTFTAHYMSNKANTNVKVA